MISNYVFAYFRVFIFQISAQESRRKKKEYVDALEKEIAKYVDENKALKERMAKIEKNQKYDNKNPMRDLFTNRIHFVER